MKKILTLILAVVCFSAAQAQSPTTERAKKVIKGERRDYDPNNASRDEAKTVIRQRDRDRRVIFDDRDDDRRDRRYSERSREYNQDRKYAYKHKGNKNKHNKYKRKGNNGKHLGWQKGKGNPHRHRD